MIAALAVALLLAGVSAGCGRDLNDRPDEDIRRAAVHYRAVAQGELARGRTAQAYTYFHEALRIDPDDAASHWGLGRIYLAAGFAERGAASLERARELDPALRDREPVSYPVPLEIGDPAVVRALLTPETDVVRQTGAEDVEPDADLPEEPGDTEPEAEPMPNPDDVPASDTSPNADDDDGPDTP
jgi:tetratricopeptide (TPR) repeat protein